jgi:hypothetical protein
LLVSWSGMCGPLRFRSDLLSPLYSCTIALVFVSCY